jgi:alcohol dehydrogenase class IV
MQIAWEFATAARIVFGRGAAHGAAGIVAAFGRRALVVTGSTPARAEWLVDGLETAGVATTLIYVEGEPDAEFVHTSAAYARRKAIDVVAAVGGGAALDAGKAIAALATNDGDIFEYLEVVGQGRALSAAPLPCVALPTTAGTGSEVTRNAVVTVPRHHVKVSLRSPLMLPRVAIVDPALTDSLPPALTAFTGLDALTQNLEPYLSPRATPLTDAVCREGLLRGARALRRAWADGADTAARDDMAVASLCGGLALANAGLGAVHGLAGPIGGLCAAPHGAVCAALLAPCVAANLAALRSRAPDHPALNRMRDAAVWLTGRPGAMPDDLVEWLGRLAADLGIPRLSHWGVTGAEVAAVVDQAGRSSSMKGNPVALTPGELTAVLQEA